MTAFGVSPDFIPARSEAFQVFPENWQAIQLFIVGSTQWRYAGSVATGLDYAGLEAAMRMLTIPEQERPELFHKARVMELAALSELRDMAERNMRTNRHRVS